MSDDLGRLQTQLNYQFKDAALLDRALTHATALDNSRGHESAATYQRLEFLGDRVLGLVIADLLMRRFPGDDEGDLSRRMTGPLRDAKTELQEWAHRNQLGTPTYTEVSRFGPDHAPQFVVSARLDDGRSANGQGGNKRDAEQRAAEAMLVENGVRKL
ncbi:MAG: ribonuclease III family protein [Alphaproteobacteria bacterium]